MDPSTAAVPPDIAASIDDAYNSRPVWTSFSSRSSPSTPTQSSFSGPSEVAGTASLSRALANGWRHRSRSLLTVAMASAHTFERSYPPQRRNRKQDVRGSPSGHSYLPSVPAARDFHESDHSDRSSAGSMLQLDLEGLDLGGPVIPTSHYTPPLEGHGSPKKPSWTRSSPQWQAHSPPQLNNASLGHSSNSKKMSAALNLARKFSPNATADPRRAPLPLAQTGMEIDSFVAHLRDDCSGTNEILGSDAILSANAVGVSASTNRGGALMLDTGVFANSFSASACLSSSPPPHSVNIPTPRTPRQASSCHAEHRGSPGKRAPWQEAISEQVLGGFASLGVPSSSAIQQQPCGTATAKPRPTLTAFARSTSRSGGLESSMGDSGGSRATSPTSPMWSTDSCGQSLWQTMMPVRRSSDALKVLEMMSIDELSRHAIDVGHLGDWEGASLVPVDSPYEGEKSTAAASWRAARKTQKKRQWISAPIVPDDELAAERTVVVSDCKASTSSRAALPSHPGDHGRSAPVTFSGLASFEMRFLRGPLAERRVHLATPAHLKEIYGKQCGSGGRQGQQRKPRAYSWGTTDRSRAAKKNILSEGPAKVKSNGATSQALRRTRSRPALQLDPFGLPDLKNSIAQSSRRLSFDASVTRSTSNYPSLLTPTHLRSGDFLTPSDASGPPKSEAKLSKAFPDVVNPSFGEYTMGCGFPAASGSTARRGGASPVKPTFHTGMASSFSSPPTAPPLHFIPSLCSESDGERQTEAAAFARALPALPITGDASSGLSSSPSKSQTSRARITPASLGSSSSATPAFKGTTSEQQTAPRLRKEPSKIGGWLKKKMGGGHRSSHTDSKISSGTTTGKKDEPEPSSVKAAPSVVGINDDPFASYRESERENARPALKSSGLRAQSFYHTAHSDRDLDVLSDLADDPHSIFAPNAFPFGKPNAGAGCGKRGTKILHGQGEAAPSWSNRGSLMPPYAAGRRASASDDDIVAHAGQAARNLSFGTIGKKEKSRSTLTSKCRAAAFTATSPVLRPSGLAATSQPRVSSPLAQRAPLISEKSIFSPPETAKPGPLHFGKGTVLTRLASDDSKMTLGSQSLQLLGIENVPADALSMIVPLPLSSASGRQERYLRLNYVPFGHEHRAEYRFNSDGSTKSTSHFSSHAPCASGTVAFSPPSWYHRLGAASIGHAKSVSSEENYPYEGAGAAAKPTYLFGAGPANAHDAHAKSAAVPNRQQTGIEAFRVTAMVLAAPEEEEEAELRPPSKLFAAAMRFSHSGGTAKSGKTHEDSQAGAAEEKRGTNCWLPEPTPFPIVLVTCCGEYLDFVSEGWEALGLGSGPVETSGEGVAHDDDDDDDDRSALFGVADLVAAGCAAVMDL